MHELIGDAGAALSAASAYFEAAPAAILVSAPQGRIERMNREAERLFGYAREELIGTPLEALVQECEEVQRLLSRAAQHAGTSPEPAATLHGRRKDASAFDVELSARPFPLADGSKLVVWLRDVSARQRALREVELANERLRLATRAAKIGIFEWDVQTEQLVWDDVLRSIYQLPPGADVDFPRWLSWLDEGERQRVQVEVQKMLEGADEVDLEFTVRIANGERRIIASRGAVERDATGAPRRLIGTNMDVTEQRVAQRRLAISERLFRSAMSFSAIGMALVDLDGRWMKVNSALSEILGYSEQELSLLTFHDLTYPADLEADLAQAARLRSGEISHYHMEKRYVRKDGQLVWALLSGAAARDDAGRALYYIAQIQDITQQKQAAEVLKKSLAEKEALLREIHHRVKNNLQVIISILRLQAQKSDAAQRIVLDDCQQRVRTMALVHERLYRGGNLETLDFGAHLAELARMLVSSFDRPGLQIRLDLHIEPLTLDIDTAIPLGLLANELISNALKHAFVGRDHGALTVALTAADHAVTLRVADDGVGLPEGVRVGSGSTLGLQLIGALARQLRGELRISHGSTTDFSLHMPLPRTEE